MNTTVNNSILILIGCIAPYWIFHHSFTTVNSFIPPSPQNFAKLPPTTTTTTTTTTRSSTTTIRTSLSNSPLFSPDDNSDDNKNNNNNKPSQEFDGFNPFQPGAKMPTKSGFGINSQTKPITTPGGQISPRQMRMKELTGNLLNCLSNDDAVAELLQSNEDFLLEQLNDVDVVLEPGSVYTPDMSREERFRVYERVMGERIGDARAPAAKKALGALLDFVMERE